ncbi:hypothetical protein L3X38_040915 [Prunus dulcis]|uniref:Isopenicillin N synthase-like Fe(2+) 2OG dioxygenase domain-containing protein n=1 Tax=Prunus dulcis TaxID=3755 RepID=A0AAD4UTQ0_PRUDU|nr:hypothetical protein L3X38_040915 [Prunus dulcis]
MRTHPTFHCPTMPDDPMVLQEYSERMREMGIQLLRGISKSLGLEECYMEKKISWNLATIFWDQISINLCRVARMIRIRLGSFLIETLIKHQGKWLNADFPPSSIGVLVADHIEILTNGKYKSLLHRVALNTEVERLSLPFFFGPSLDAIVKPEPEFVDDHNPPSYRQMTYKEYLESNSRYHVIEAKANLINEALLSS